MKLVAALILVVTVPLGTVYLWKGYITPPVTVVECEVQEYILRSPSAGTMTMDLCPETAAAWGVESGPKDVQRPDLTTPTAPVRARHPGDPRL